jgi:hypothetical protein
MPLSLAEATATTGTNRTTILRHGPGGDGWQAKMDQGVALTRHVGIILLFMFVGVSIISSSMVGCRRSNSPTSRNPAICAARTAVEPGVSPWLRSARPREW